MAIKLSKHIALYEKHKGEKEFALPCIAFSVKERELIKEHGFLTFPEFLDNGFIESGAEKLNLKRFRRQLEKYREQIKFAVSPDNMPDEALELKREYPEICWIYPLHKFYEAYWAVRSFCMVAFPYRQEWMGETIRDYSMRQFLEVVPYEKRWYLGFWDESHPEILLSFKGMDTTLPETYSGKYGRLWNGWKKKEKPKGMKTIDIFHHNLHSLANSLNELFNQKSLEVVGL